VIRARYAAATLAALAVAVAIPSVATVKTVSRDGEATVYLSRDFSKPFDLAYAVTLRPALGNTSFATAGVMVLGMVGPASVYVGVYSGPTGKVAAFTTMTGAARTNAFKTLSSCLPSCTIELRGDAKNIQALVNDRVVGTWMRSALRLVRPYVQINAEATAIGDSVHASLTTVRATIDGEKLPAPTCAITTQGVEPTVDPNVIWFSGTRRADARVTYISLVDGRAMDRCP